MRTHPIHVAVLALTVLVLGSGTLAAQGKGKGNGNGNGKGNDKGQGSAAHGQVAGAVVVQPGATPRPVTGAVIARPGQPVHADGRTTPPGLATKPGRMPPGQYKKHVGTSGRRR